jgi:hypothetical protein
MGRILPCPAHQPLLFPPTARSFFLCCAVPHLPLKNPSRQPCPLSCARLGRRRAGPTYQSLPCRASSSSRSTVTWTTQLDTSSPRSLVPATPARIVSLSPNYLAANGGLARGNQSPCARGSASDGIARGSLPHLRGSRPKRPVPVPLPQRGSETWAATAAMESSSALSFEVQIRARVCWGLVLKCYELRTRQHKMLNVNVLRP